MNPPPDTPRRNPADVPIVHTLYETYCRWHELITKFPKSERYTLGQTCQNCLLAVLENVLAAAGQSDKRVKVERLRLASAKLDTLRLLIRLAKDTKCLPNNAYLELESKLHEVGRMLGGWIKTFG